MLDIEGAQSYVTFRQLGGDLIAVDEVLAEIARWPMDGVLGFLGALSLEAVQTGKSFSDPRQQGAYLNWAIVDDFPREVPRAYEMYAPGRVPFTGGHYLLLHEQNIAWLSHAALLHSRAESITHELSQELRRRVCRLLLIVNDLFSGRPDVPSSLADRRAFVLNWLRHGQFNRFFEPFPTVMLKLARQRILIKEILPEFFPEVESVFIEATNGVSVERYFEILALFVAHIHHGMAADRRWLSRDTLCAAVGAGRDEIELILRRWITSPHHYRDDFKEWNRSRPTTGYMLYFDFVLLRKTPLIEARPGELICPSIPFLLQKVVDEPYFILSDYLKEPGRFQAALGYAYQKYAQRLVERVTASDAGGAWEFKHSPRDHKGRELSDSYLQRGRIAVSFEHKGQRPGTDFLRGGSGERVLGPCETVLARLDNGESVTLGDGIKGDEGLLTRGLWQQSLAGPSLLIWAERAMGEKPLRVFPIITHLSELRADQVSRLAYLEPLIQHAQLYPDDFWEPPQWLHVSELEALAELAEHGGLDLQVLLQDKAERYKSKRFDIFLDDRFGGIPVDKKLIETAEALLKNAKTSFWPETK